MNKSLRLTRGLFLLALLFSLQLPAQNASDVVVPVTVTTSASPKFIRLSFPATANAVSTVIGKKLINQLSWSFAVLPAGVTSVIDTAVQIGVGYEYFVIKQASVAPTARYGLVYAGIELPPTFYRGRMVLVVDNALSGPLANELNRYVQDLRGDGWEVVRHDIDVASSTVQSVKSLIRADYDADPNNTIAALLFGNIPVPYSGDINPDGHPEHQGAWPTDYYYSDMDEAPWTDNIVNNNGAARAANRNVPGDGKFDPSQTPTPPELVVSRVDFSNLSGWPESQTELYRRYLNKNHAFRTGDYRPSNNTLVDDNFGYAGGQAYAQSGYANGYALTGANSVVQADFFNDTDNQSYLVGYGCGPGNYTGAAGVGNSDNFKTDSVNIVFSMLFGSYHGDWDYETNPFMPSALASKGGILTCAWAGRPNWYFHHTGLGEPILTSTYLTWINSFLADPIYPLNPGADLIHVGLLGDPTLRAHAVKPPQNVAAVANCNNIGLNWTASADPNILGYIVYWAPSPDSVFTPIDFVNGVGYIDTIPVDGPNYYQVKALVLQNTPTGSYFNQSLGIQTSANFNPDPPEASASATDVSCNGAADGAISLSVSGGTNLVYLWSNGANTANLSDLGPGTYTVTITDAQFCTATASAAVSEPPAIILTASASDISCFGLDNGSIDLTSDGGTPPYLFAWSNGSAQQNLDNLGPGAFTVTLTDANGCTATASADIAEPVAIALELNAVDVACNGESNGGINLAIGGGVPGYTFLWSNGATTAFLANVTAGSYTVTATDSNGCTETANAQIGEPPAILIETTVSNAGCAGATNGAISLNVGSGVPGYTFLWSNGTTEEDLENVAAGTYTVTVTDAGGCTAAASATVQQITTLTLQATATNAACFGQPGGSATAIAGGGAPDYSFLWSTGAAAANISDLVAGTYTVTVTDDAGCTQTATAVVGQPAALALGTVVTPVKCNGAANGAIDLAVSGGTSPYTYQWSNGSTTQDQTNLAPGIHTVTATDANGCTQTATATVTQPAVLLTSVAVTNVSCFGGTNGAINLSISGGTPPYTFTGNGTLNMLPAGAYTLTIVDANGCSMTVSATVTQPPALVLTKSVSNVLCKGDATGSITLIASGGTPTYTFQWSNGQTTKDLGNLTAGTYTVTLTDNNACTATTNATVTEPTTLLASISDLKNETCAGSADGQATAQASGGTSPYTFAWSTGVTTPAVTNLSAGAVTCTITDANGCTKTAEANIIAPPPSGAAIFGLDSACLDLPTQYSLPGSFSGYQWTASNNGTVTQGQGTSTVSVRWSTPGANTLVVHFTNAANCPDSAVLNLTVNICVGTSAPVLPGVRVMPNPFSDQLTIAFDRPVQPGARLRLTDMQGRLIAEQFSIMDQTRLETAHLPAGAYLLQIMENGQTGVWKVVKAE